MHYKIEWEERRKDMIVVVIMKEFCWNTFEMTWKFKKCRAMKNLRSISIPPLKSSFNWAYQREEKEYDESEMRGFEINLIKNLYIFSFSVFAMDRDKSIGKTKLNI